MKIKFLLALILPVTLIAQSPLKKLKVLFIGNSYTQVNNLPFLVSNIALANGDSLYYDSNTPGGFTFFNHSADATTLSKISAGHWDFVVLQAQSQEPAFSPNQVASQTLPYAIKLDTLIKHYNACAKTVFYETWGRKNGDVANCQFYPPVCTYLGMQNRLRVSYKLFADTCKALMAPAGEAFRKCIAAQPTLNLYQADDSHPSLEGSFLTAAVFYELLFRKSVVTTSYNPGLAIGSHSFLLNTAHTVVNDSLTIWNVGKFKPVSSFSFSNQVSAYQFQSQQQHYAHQWYFGDGNGSTLINPSHTYTVSGTYTVSHVVKYRCENDSSSNLITVSVPLVSSIADLNNVPGIQVFPNPCRTELMIKNLRKEEHISFAKAINALGEEFCLPAAETKISVQHLEPGVYYLQLVLREAKYVLKFIKE